MGGGDTINKGFFSREGVGKGWRSIRQRIDQRLNERGEKWSAIYNDLKLDKATASRIRNGIIIPPQWMRIRIAERLEIDSSIIWTLSFPKKTPPLNSGLLSPLSEFSGRDKLNDGEKSNANND